MGNHRCSVYTSGWCCSFLLSSILRIYIADSNTNKQMEFSRPELLDIHTFLGIFYLLWSSYWFISYIQFLNRRCTQIYEASVFFSHVKPAGILYTGLHLIEPLFKVFVPCIGLFVISANRRELLNDQGFFDQLGVELLLQVLMLLSLVRTGAIDLTVYFARTISQEFSTFFYLLTFMEQTALLFFVKYPAEVDQSFHNSLCLATFLVLITSAASIYYEDNINWFFFRIVAMFALGSYYLQTADALFVYRERYNTVQGNIMSSLLFWIHFTSWAWFLLFSTGIVLSKSKQQPPAVSEESSEDLEMESLPASEHHTGAGERVLLIENRAHSPSASVSGGRARARSSMGVE